MVFILSYYTLERQEILLTANGIRNNGENILDIVKEAYRGIKSSDMILERGWEGREVGNISLILIYQS